MPPQYDPIFDFIFNKDDASVLLWLEKGGNVNIRGPVRNTPLMHAIEVEMDSVILPLLQKGSNPNLKNTRKENALVMALSSSKDPMVAIWLMEKSTIPIDPNLMSGDLPILHLCMYYRRVDVFHFLLQRGANPDAVGGNLGESALFLLIDRLGEYCNEMIRLLLDHGANPNFYNQTHPHWRSHQSYLKLAIHNNQSELVKWLLDAGADVNFQDPFSGDTALHYAALYRPNLIPYLAYRGADKEIRNQDGKTPLDVVKETLERMTNQPLSHGIHFEKKADVLQSLILLQS